MNWIWQSSWGRGHPHPPAQCSGCKALAPLDVGPNLPWDHCSSWSWRVYSGTRSWSGTRWGPVLWRGLGVSSRWGSGSRRTLSWVSPAGRLWTPSVVASRRAFCWIFWFCVIAVLQRWRKKHINNFTYNRNTLDHEFWWFYIITLSFGDSIINKFILLSTIHHTTHHFINNIMHLNLWSNKKV